MILGASSFCLALGIHIVLWHWFTVRRQILWLVVIFFVMPLALGNFLAYLLAVSLGAVYVMTYPAIQAQSPTLTLLLYLHQSEARGGATRAEITRFLEEQNMFQERIADMKRDGIWADGGPTRFGRILRGLFRGLRWVLRLEENG